MTGQLREFAEQYSVQHELDYRILERLREGETEIPFPPAKGLFAQGKSLIFIPPPGGSCDRIGRVEVRPQFLLSRKEVAVEKVLCIDDDLSLLRLYQEELAEEGYKVVLARDGKEGLAKFEKEKPHVVVMDIRMPVMDGIETLTAMLGKDRQVPVILNTAYPQYKENFMTWGAEAYVVKSSDLTELKQKIRDILDRRKKMGSQKE